MFLKVKHRVMLGSVFLSVIAFRFEVGANYRTASLAATVPAGKPLSENEKRRMKQRLEGFVLEFSKNVLSVKESKLPQGQSESKLKCIAKKYIAIDKLRPTLIGREYRNLDDKVKEELRDILASLMSQRLLEILPAGNSTKTDIKDVIQPDKNEPLLWRVTVIYKIKDKKGRKKQYNVVFDVRIVDGVILIYDAKADGVSAVEFIKSEILGTIKNIGIGPTIDKLRKLYVTK